MQTTDDEARKRLAHDLGYLRGSVRVFLGDLERYELQPTHTDDERLAFAGRVARLTELTETERP